MSGCAAWQEQPDADVRFFNRDEEDRIARFKIPGERRGNAGWGGGATYYPRKPIESPRRWFADHAAKLRSLEEAEGLR